MLPLEFNIGFVICGFCILVCIKQIVELLKQN